MSDEVERGKLLYPESPHWFTSFMSAVCLVGSSSIYTLVHKSVYVFGLHQQHPSRRVLVPRLEQLIEGVGYCACPQRPCTVPVSSVLHSAFGDDELPLSSQFSQCYRLEQTVLRASRVDQNRRRRKILTHSLGM